MNEIKIQYAELNEGQRTFLKEYKPKHDFFTSYEEIQAISQALELKDKTTEEARAIRNSVVRFYHEIGDADPNKRWEYMTSTQSVTAAIDHLKRTF